MAIDIRKISDLTPDTHNANAGTERGRYMLEQSLREAGAGRSIVVDQHGHVIAGNKTLEAAEELGLPIVVVKTNGSELVVVQREDLDLDDERARKLAYYDNRTSEVGLSWSASQIVQDLEAGLDLSDMFRDEELNAIVEQAADAMLEAAVEEQALLKKEARGIAEEQAPSQALGVDLIWTQTSVACCTASHMGWMYGIQSGNTPCPCASPGTLHQIAFIDNEFKQYRHEAHLSCVRDYRPKYATVRDIMTRTQCAAAGIEFYEFEQVMDWADELAQYAENVIVIPKYDCLDQIPEQFMVGYSVPTSYGGTPLPVRAFAGRRVHLLGGNPEMQIQYFQQIPDSVVSLDNNQMHLRATFGNTWTHSGYVNLQSIPHMAGIESSYGLWPSVILSQANFVSWFKKNAEGRSAE